MAYVALPRAGCNRDRTSFKSLLWRSLSVRLGVHKLRIFLAVPSILLFVSILQASTAPAPGTGIPVVNGNCTLVTTAGIRESSNDSR
jgi:hypothetical protein